MEINELQKIIFVYSLLPNPYSLLPTPYSLLPTPYSLLPIPFAIMTQISLIIPVRNRQHYTQNILSQIFQQIPQANNDNTSVISVIIVDDDSTDGTREMIRRQFPNVYLIEGDGNLWWTGGICLGEILLNRD
ncbi:MAG: glycosyltransferase [Moorea sp. SIO3C2]|nr:glycosyltransferase [Moorena sp. SIO3C2]